MRVQAVMMAAAGKRSEKNLQLGGAAAAKAGPSEAALRRKAEEEERRKRDEERRKNEAAAKQAKIDEIKKQAEAAKGVESASRAPAGDSDVFAARQKAEEEAREKEREAHRLAAIAAVEQKSAYSAAAKAEAPSSAGRVAPSTTFVCLCLSALAYLRPQSSRRMMTRHSSARRLALPRPSPTRSVDKATLSKGVALCVVSIGDGSVLLTLSRWRGHFLQ